MTLTQNIQIIEHDVVQYIPALSTCLITRGATATSLDCLAWSIFDQDVRCFHAFNMSEQSFLNASKIGVQRGLPGEYGLNLAALCIIVVMRSRGMSY